MPVLTPIPPQPIADTMVAPRSNQTVSFASSPTKMAMTAAPAGPRFTLADVKISQLSLDLAASVGYGDLFHNDTNASILFYLIEFITMATELQSQSTPNVSAVMGVGVRVAVASQKIDDKFSGNFAGIAAAATLQTVNQNIKVTVFGCPNAMQDKFFRNFATPSRFDLDAMKNFGKAVAQLAQDMVDQAAKDESVFSPKVCYIAERLPLPYQLVSTGTGCCYALHRISEGDSYKQAVDHWAANAGKKDSWPYYYVDPMEIRLVYMELVGNLNSSPNREQRNGADAILRLGR